MNQLQASIDPALLGVEESIVGYKKDMIEPLIILPKKDLNAEIIFYHALIVQHWAETVVDCFLSLKPLTTRNSSQ
jgi:hypothetical protein